MNIFFLDHDITKCAQAHCDKHVNKMILESAQLLASAIHVLDPKLAQDQQDNNGLYRLTHKNHPCAVWVRADAHNYMYLLDLMEALNTEAQWRYARQTDHLSLVKAREWYPPQMPMIKFTEPPKCVHDDFKHVQDTVDAYRNYYRRDKRPIASWTKREVPHWFNE